MSLYLGFYNVRFAVYNVNGWKGEYICVICDEKKIDERGCVGAPDLIIEIVSPGNSKREMKTKYELYEENGVREYWIANPLEKNI